jgi:hypothetical protein
MLNPAIIGRLQTAARGAAEQSLAAWMENLETNIRGNLNDANVENIKVRLASIPDYQFRRGSETESETTILDEALKAELSEEQQTAWKKEVDARSEFRSKAISEFIVAQFDRRHLLMTEQFDKLRPKVEQLLKEYDQDIGRMFTYYGGGWHMQHYLQFMPFAGIPEKELKEILSKEQWDSWAGTHEFSNANSYWENVKRNHDQRIKRDKR